MASLDGHRRAARLSFLCVLAFGAPPYTALRSEESDHSAVKVDLGASIREGRALAGRELAGRPSLLLSAAQGKAFVLELADEKLSASRVETALPVYKAFGMNADGQRLLYRSLQGDAPSGELVVEDLATGSTRRLDSHVALEAAWSPRDPDVLAYTFAAGEGYGLAIADARTGAVTVVRNAETLADYLAWEADGSGVYYYRSVEMERVGLDDHSGQVVAEHSYSVLTPSFHPVPGGHAMRRAASEEVPLTALPAGFPVLQKLIRAEELSDPILEESRPDRPLRERTLVSPQLPADLHAFRVSTPTGDREVLGENLLADAPISVRELPDGPPRLLGHGRVLKVLDRGILVRSASASGGTLEFLAWDGSSASVAAAAAVSYGIPLATAYISQGGQSFPSPGCYSYYTHKSTSSMGYANDMINGAGHIMASAPGLVAYVKNDVTCNSCAGASCSDYRSSCASNSGWGNVVILEHADGTWTKYTHLRPGSALVSLGQSVCAGLWIGTQGHTGCTAGTVCGDHLHFQRQASSGLSGQSVRIDFFDGVNPLYCYRTHTSALTERSACTATCVNPAVPASNWKGEYFPGTQLAGSPLMVRDEGTGSLNFDWGGGSPGCGLPADGFSARFTRTASFSAGTHRFTVTSDDGFRFYVDGVLRLDKWFDQAPTAYTVDVALSAGSHALALEYYENLGGAVAKLSWQALGPVEVIVDDLGAGFERFGPSQYWWQASIGYLSHMYWTYVNGGTVSNYSRWTPNLSAGGSGNYAVYVFIPRNYATSQQAKYRVRHNGVDHYSAPVNQNAYYDQWVSIGTYSFSATGGEYVELTDATGESYSSGRKIGFDAVKFVK